MSDILLSGEIKILSYQKQNLITIESKLKLKLKNKLSLDKRKLYKNRINDIKNQKLRNLILFAFANKNDRLVINLIKRNFPDTYYDYAYALFEFAFREKLFGIIHRMMSYNKYLDLMKNYIKNNDYTKKYNLNVLENMMCYLLSNLIDIDDENGIIFFTKAFDIYGIDFEIINYFLECSIKNNSQNIYNYLYTYFKVDNKKIYSNNEIDVANTLLNIL